MIENSLPQKLEYSSFKSSIHKIINDHNYKNDPLDNSDFNNLNFCEEMFYSYYYLSYGKAAFLKKILPFIQQKLKVVIKADSDKIIFNQTSRKYLAVLIEISISVLQKTILQDISESLSKSQNIFQFPKQSWKKFLKAKCYHGLKQFMEKQLEKSRTWQTSLLKQCKVCKQYQEIIRQLSLQSNNFCPLNKFMDLYQQVILYIFQNLYSQVLKIDKVVNQYGQEHTRLATFIIYTMVITKIHKTQSHYENFQILVSYIQNSHINPGIARQTYQNINSQFSFEIFYNFVTSADISFVRKFYQHLRQYFITIIKSK